MAERRNVRKTASKKAKNTLQDAGHQLRRAFEHLGRIDVLEGMLSGANFTDVTMLVNFAQKQLSAGNFEDAAEILRAAEHASFAAIAPKEPGEGAQIAGELKDAVAAEIEQLSRHAEDLWSQSDKPRHGAIATLYGKTLEQAHRSFTRGAYFTALELARAAEALARVEHWRVSMPQAREDLTGRMAS